VAPLAQAARESRIPARPEAQRFIEPAGAVIVWTYLQSESDRLEGPRLVEVTEEASAYATVARFRYNEHFIDEQERASELVAPVRNDQGVTTQRSFRMEQDDPAARRVRDQEFDIYYETRLVGWRSRFVLSIEGSHHRE